jgi:hypothetical protein
LIIVGERRIKYLVCWPGKNGNADYADEADFLRVLTTDDTDGLGFLRV